MTSELTEHTGEGDLRAVASSALGEALEELLSEEANADLRELLPPDFAARLSDLAWRHQFDLDKARFRREAKALLRSIAADAPAEEINP